MTSYSSIKTSKFKKNTLRWIENTGGVEITNMGKHTKIHCIHNGQSFPLPTSHKYINKFIIKNLIKWLEENNVCTEDEFNNNI